jgi:hypothetical protein
MSNVLFSDGRVLSRRYDLKGNSDPNRTSVVEKRKKKTKKKKGGSGGGGGSIGKGEDKGQDIYLEDGAADCGDEEDYTAGTMLDHDYHRLGKPLKLSAERRQRLVVQIRKDLDFLQSQGLIDYSLLLGVHDCEGWKSPAVGAAKWGGENDAGGGAGNGSGGGGRGRKSSLQKVGKASSFMAETALSSHSSHSTYGIGSPQAGGGSIPSHSIPSFGSGGIVSEDWISEDWSQLYYIGFVDLLEQYSWRWGLQRAALCLVCKDTTQVSGIRMGTARGIQRALPFVFTISPSRPLTAGDSCAPPGVCKSAVALH